MHEEVFRIAHRENLFGLIPALDKRIAMKPWLTGRFSADDPRQHLAKLKIAQTRASNTGGGQPTGLSLDRLLTMVRSKEAKARIAGLRELVVLSDRITALKDRGRVAGTLVPAARDLIWTNAGTAAMQSALTKFHDAISLSEVLALSRVDRLGYDQKAVARALSASLLKWYADQRSSDCLVQLLADDCRLVRARAASALGHDRANAQAGLRRLLVAGATSDVRLRAVTAMTTPREVRGAQERALLQALKDESEAVRRVAVEKITPVAGEHLVKPLVNLALTEKKPDFRVQKAIQVALIAIGPAALPEIERALAIRNICSLRKARDDIKRRRN